MTQFQVADMSCGHCVGAITRAIQARDARAQISADLAAHSVSIESRLSAEELARLIRDAGFTPEPR